MKRGKQILNWKGTSVKINFVRTDCGLLPGKVLDVGMLMAGDAIKNVRSAIDKQMTSLKFDCKLELEEVMTKVVAPSCPSLSLIVPHCPFMPLIAPHCPFMPLCLQTARCWTRPWGRSTAK